MEKKKTKKPIKKKVSTTWIKNLKAELKNNHYTFYFDASLVTLKERVQIWNDILKRTSEDQFKLCQNISKKHKLPIPSTTSTFEFMVINN